MLHPVIAPTVAVFLFASLVLAVTPGPGVIYIVSRTLAGGRRAGLASVGGAALGNLVNAALASLGLAAVLAVSARAFAAVKLAGAAYLLYLGVRELCRARRASGEERRPPVTGTRVFRDGFLVALLNPKTALFFGAFLPQFVDPSRSPLAQSLALGAAFAAIALGTDTLYVLAAARLGPGLSRLGVQSVMTRFAGLTFIALGLVVACSDSRSAR
jgi:threonine/homoserine/homoserine lactone efflux protein